MGPMTGRAAGFCAGYSVPGYMNPGFGRGFWGRGGGGRGWRNRFYATGLTGWQRAAMGWGAYGGVAPAAPTAADELAGLKAQSQYLQDALKDISKRIEEIEAADK